MVKSFKESHAKYLEKLPPDNQRQETKTATDDLVNTPKHTVWMKENPIPYISKDKFSQEGIFHYWSGRQPGYDHVNQTYPDVVRMYRQFHACPASGGGIERVFSQEKDHGQDPGKYIEGINQYDVVDL
jgi:hypothetical protein